MILNDPLVGGIVPVLEVPHHVHHVAEAVAEGGHGVGIVDQAQQTPDKKDHTHHRQGVGQQPEQAQIFVPPQPEGIACRQNGNDHRFFQKRAKRIAHNHLTKNDFGHQKRAKPQFCDSSISFSQFCVNGFVCHPEGSFLKNA